MVFNFINDCYGCGCRVAGFFTVCIAAIEFHYRRTSDLSTDMDWIARRRLRVTRKGASRHRFNNEPLERKRESLF